MSLEGDAVIDNNGILQLTNESIQVVSHAFYKYPIQFKNSSNGKIMSFSTTFAFALINECGKLGGHDFAFTISHSLGLFNTKGMETSRTYSRWNFTLSITPSSVTSTITMFASASKAYYRTNLFQSINLSVDIS